MAGFFGISASLLAQPTCTTTNFSFNCNPGTVNLFLDANGEGTLDLESFRNRINNPCRGSASITATKTSFTCADLGDNSITVTASITGATRTCNITVRVRDNSDPVAVCKNINFNGGNLSAADIDDGSYDNCGIVTYELSGKTAYGCDDEDGDYEVTLTVYDASGNSSSCNAIVSYTNNGITAASISANRTIVYYGAPAPYNCATLTAVGAGGSGYSFAWSTSESTESITVCPTASESYSVTITDGNGCSAEAEIDICVVDVRCGSKNDKVQVCHKNNGKNSGWNNVCIAPSAVQAHLAQGGYLGACGSSACSSTSSVAASDEIFEFVANVYPNPSSGSAFINFMVNEDMNTTISVYDISGKLIQTVYNEVTLAGMEMVADLRAENLAKGAYIVRLSTENGEVKNINFIKTR